VYILIAQHLSINLSVLPELLAFLKLRKFDEFHFEEIAVQTSNLKDHILITEKKVRSRFTNQQTNKQTIDPYCGLVCMIGVFENTI